MLWLDEAGDRPVFCRPGLQSKKQLFTICCNHGGPVVVDILPEKMTMNTHVHYTVTVLTKGVAAVHEAAAIRGNHNNIVDP